MRTLNRRAFLRVTALGAAASAAACALPTASTVSQVSPVTTRGQIQSAEDTAWTDEWKELYLAAKEEGKLSLLSVVGGGYRKAIESFESAYPGITVDHLAESTTSVWLENVRDERRAGIYSFDLALVAPTRALPDGQPEGLWAPVRPLLFHPDILADRTWRDGLNARFLDTGGELCFNWEYQVIHAYAINTDLVSEGEIGSAKDLVDPKWTGKILTLDPRLGSGLLSAARVAQTWGTDLLKQLLVDQQPTIHRAPPNGVTEPLARGSYPIALGVRPKALRPLQEQGLGHNIRYLDLPDADFVAANSLFYFDQAPHPNAARLFANWMLTTEGQTILASGLATNSARTDVDTFEPDGIGSQGKTYFEQDREANYAQIAETRTYVYSLLGPPA